MKILKLLILIILTNKAYSQTKLPFIGTKEFNFSGGSCCNQSITIHSNGLCEIKAYEAPEFGNTVTLFYSGKFSPIIWVYKNGKKSFGYKIEGKYIYSLVPNGKVELGCKEENKPCKERLD